MKTGLVRIETDGDIAPSLYYAVTIKSTMLYHRCSGERHVIDWMNNDIQLSESSCSKSRRGIVDCIRWDIRHSITFDFLRIQSHSSSSTASQTERRFNPHFKDRPKLNQKVVSPSYHVQTSGSPLLGSCS